MTILYLATDRALAVLHARDDRCDCALHLSDQQAQCVAVDPSQLEHVYCGTFEHGVWRSSDAGRNWTLLGGELRSSKVLSLAVSPNEHADRGGMLYAGTEPSAVFRSPDAGDTWQKCKGLSELPSASEWSFPPRPHTHHVRWIQPDPHTAGRLFVAIEAGALVRTIDGGRSWIDRVPTGPIDTHQLAYHPAAPGRLYSAAGDGYFESRDGGDTWQPMEEGLEHSYVWSVAVDPGDPDTRIIAAAASPRESHDAHSAESFLYRRTADSPWQLVRDGLPASPGRRTALVAAHPAEPGMFFAVWESSLYRSHDGGAMWRELPVHWPDGFVVGEPRGLVVSSRDD